MAKKATVRRYSKRDIPYIIGLVMRWVPELPNYQGVTIHEDRIKFMLEHNETNDASLMLQVLVTETDQIIGCIAGYCVTSLISWDKVASDIFMFILPEWRSAENADKLLAVYIDWARARKAKIVGSTQTSAYREEAFTKFLAKRGFEQIGFLYRLKQKG